MWSLCSCPELPTWVNNPLQSHAGFMSAAASKAVDFGDKADVFHIGIADR
jgi:hypothetical protein